MSVLLLLQLRESVCCCGDLVRLGAVTKQMLYSMFMQQVASCVVIASVHGNMPSYKPIRRHFPMHMQSPSCHAYAWQSEGNTEQHSAFYWVIFWVMNIALHLMDFISLYSLL